VFTKGNLVSENYLRGVDPQMFDKRGKGDSLNISTVQLKNYNKQSVREGEKIATFEVRWEAEEKEEILCLRKRK